MGDCRSVNEIGLSLSSEDDMALTKLGGISKGVRIGLLVAGIIGLVTCAMAWLQVQQERRIDEEDLDRRVHMLAHQMSEKARNALQLPDADARQALGNELQGYRRLIGFAAYRPDGSLLAAGKGISEFAEDLKEPVNQAIRSGGEVVERIRAPGGAVHLLAFPLRRDNGSLAGVLTVLHDASHLEERAASRLMRFATWIIIVSLLLLALVVGTTWSAYDRPLHSLAEWMRRLRTGDEPEALPTGLPVALLASESDRLAASFRAVRAAGWMESRELVREQNVWTRERLRAHAVDCLRGGQLVVVSNREPYMHVLRDGKPHLIVPAGGLVTALDPVLQACGGLWVAHGAGEADRVAADDRGRLTVPPHDSRYTLRRVWLSRDEEQGYYYGFANEGLWPLCHIAHERPVFRASDWDHYVRANQRFADTVLEEVGSSDAMVLVQDYQLALVPQMLKAEQPNLRVGIFWHIPWPNPETFRICPWRNEILQGMLGADLMGFHLQQYCNNFLDTVDRVVEARLDWDHFAVELRGHRLAVRPFPISVESWAERPVPAGDELAQQIEHLRKTHELGNRQIIVGVERIDYTKGLVERFRAIARFLEKNPQHHDKVSFVVLGAPSRTHIRRYRELIAELEALADEINWRHQSGGWKPLRFLVAHHDAAAVHAFMKMSSICIVSALHDGMNLVAKEFVAAKDDGDGVLILSEFAGAARELSDALIINPYDTEQFADAIRYAVEMDAAERRARMERMRRIVEENNIYRWAASLLTDLAGTRAPDSKSRELILPHSAFAAATA
jgi:trehalose 6-phosphate synthase